MTQEALMLALDALDNLMYWDNGKPDYDDAREAITAIKEALRENAMREVQRLGQEPVKYSDYEPDGVHHNKPPQRTWVGLTDEERNLISRHHAYVDNIIKATEAKLKELNT
jgi:hypothetical protein